MNILELCLSRGFGGLELYASKAATKLQNSGHNVYVIVRQGTFLDEKLGSAGVRRDYLHTISQNLPFITAWRLKRYLEHNQIDVLHVHWGHDLFLAVLAKFLSRRQVKLVYTRQMALTRRKYDLYHRFLYHYVDDYLVITEQLSMQVKKYLPLDPARLRVLYYGVPSGTVDTVDCGRYLNENKIDDNSFKIAIFGRIEEGKGQHLVLDAVRCLVIEEHNIELAIIGHVMDKAYFSNLESISKESGLEEKVHFVGFHDNPVSIMPCFDAVVLASQCETFGLVLPEAMRAGVAVIGSNCGGVPEIISHGETGLLFESENSEDLSNQLRKLIGDPQYCKKLANAGKIDADERFSEEKHFKRLLDILETA